MGNSTPPRDGLYVTLHEPRGNSFGCPCGEVLYWAEATHTTRSPEGEERAGLELACPCGITYDTALPLPWETFAIHLLAAGVAVPHPVAHRQP